jgi:SAM-dependent methyltransferase
MSEQSARTPTIAELKELYGKNVNVMQLFRELGGTNRNSREAILVSYDLQSGSYTQALEKPDYREKHERYTAALAQVLERLDGDSLLEAGVGEATTLCNTVAKLRRPPPTIHGFDISWSRIAYARRFASGFAFAPRFSTGDLFHIPAPDGSFDIVLTSHAIEPNHGRECEALAELFRVARKWLVVFEPSYELGSAEARARIEANGYVRGLPEAARALGLEVVEHRLLEFSYNPLNPTALLLIRKPEPAASAAPAFGCPLCRQPLAAVHGQLFCESCSLVFPVIDGIPCLLPGNGILASKFLADFA